MRDPDYAPLTAARGTNLLLRRDDSVLLELSSRTAQTLRMFGQMRRRRALGAEETLIYLAVGHLGISAPQRFVTLRPVTYVEISSLLGIPKETVRRKSARLLDLELLVQSCGGVCVGNIEHWQSLAGAGMGIG